VKFRAAIADLSAQIGDEKGANRAISRVASKVGSRVQSKAGSAVQSKTHSRAVSGDGKAALEGKKGTAEAEEQTGTTQGTGTATSAMNGHKTDATAAASSAEETY